MTPITLLEAPAYTKEKQQVLIDLVLALKKTYIQDFLRQRELPVSGTKPDLRDRLQEALDAGDVTYEGVVHFLDSVAPWGKQHVILYNGPWSDLQLWKDGERLRQHLENHGVGDLYNSHLPLVLPEELTLSSIMHSDGTLRITAVQKREYTERMPEHDERRQTENGTLITLRAYAHHLSRMLVAFEWNLNANTAMLQITQLSSNTHYEDVAEEFFGLIGHWLDITQFSPVDIRQAIRNLHELEEDGSPEARSHGIHYRTLRGRGISASSPSPRDSVLGETVIDDAMSSVRDKGVGHLGNFYWLPGKQPGPVINPLKSDVHMFIVGDKSRINFPTPNSEEVVRYVLHRVRELS